MIPYMIGKLAPNSSHLTRGLVKYVPGRGYFRAVPCQNGDKLVTSPPLPPIVERFKRRRENLDHTGFPKANNLAPLVLDCERATKKTGSHGFPEGEQFSNAGARL